MLTWRKKYFPRIQKRKENIALLDQQQEEEEQLEHDSFQNTIQQNERFTRATSSSEHLVTDDAGGLLPNLPSAHYAGHVPLYPFSMKGNPQKQRNLFYWMFSPDDSHDKSNDDGTAPLVIWLNGGPGSSSLEGLFFENGPFRIDVTEETPKIRINPYSWHKTPAWVVYVDQPVGTGLSYVQNGTMDDLCTNDECIHSDFYEFLRELLWLHRDTMLVPYPDNHHDSIESSGTMYRLKRELYIMGESYAGHYIPTIVDYVLKQNTVLTSINTTNTTHTINKNEGTPPILMPVTGMAIGNGYMDARTQYSNSDSLYANGFIDMSQKVSLDQREERCIKLLDEEKIEEAVDCFDYFDDIEITSDDGYFCSYDARLWLPDGQLYPLGQSELEAYLGGGDEKTRSRLGLTDAHDHNALLRAIHATGRMQPFKIASGQISEALCNEIPNYLISVQREVVNILDAGVRTLFYNGVEDLMCDHIRNERFLDQLPWDGRIKWTTSKRYVWKTDERDGTPAGFVKTHQNLSFLKILGAGHFVPMDQPEVSLELIKGFVSGNSKMFQGSKQHIGQKQPEMTHCKMETHASTDEQYSTMQSDPNITITKSESTSTYDQTWEFDGSGLIKNMFFTMAILLVIALVFWAGRRSNMKNGEKYTVISVDNAIC